MIEKTYGRPAIADIVGYTSMPDRPSEAIMQAKVEGTLIEIPIDAARTEPMMKNNPPGSRISVCFYNCEWHVEGKTDSSGNSSPRIGISISDLLHDQDLEATTEEMSAACDTDSMSEEDIQQTQDYINEVEVEFKAEAEQVLKQIKLSHMQIGTN
jgi:hypothetical protein